MRASVASLSRKSISIFFAATLALGLMPAAAFAEPVGDAAASQNSESAGADSDIAQKRKASAYEDQATSESLEDGEDAQQAISSEGDETSPANVISSEASEAGEVEQSRPSNEDDDSNSAIPAGGIINQEVSLDTVAQAESTRSFFLAQTLESTKTVPMVSAKLPIDTGANDAADVSVGDGVPSSEGEGNGNSDGASGPDDPVDPSFTLGSSEGDSAAVAAESTVIGSFEYRGITYAVEPGGESVAVVAADYAKLPSDFIEAQTIVLPSVVSPDDVDYYSVTRIADDAFASLTAVAAAAAENGQDADASSDIQAQAEACAYEDQATSSPSIVSAVVDLNDGSDSQHVISSEGAEADPTPHVISSEGDEVPGVEKSRPYDEGEGEALTGSSDESAIGITAITIPASITTIEDDALTGFDTLRYVIVSEDNPNYSMYDGCLYDKPLSSLLLIPEGRLGAVRIAPSVTSIDPEVFSHCPSVDALVADADSAAFQLLQGSSEIDESNKAVQVESALSDSEDPFLEDVLARVDSLNESLGEVDASPLADSAKSSFSSDSLNLDYTKKTKNFYSLYYRRGPGYIYACTSSSGVHSERSPDLNQDSWSYYPAGAYSWQATSTFSDWTMIYGLNEYWFDIYWSDRYGWWYVADNLSTTWIQGNGAQSGAILDASNMVCLREGDTLCERNLYVDAGNIRWRTDGPGRLRYRGETRAYVTSGSAAITLPEYLPEENKVFLGWEWDVRDANNQILDRGEIPRNVVTTTFDELLGQNGEVSFDTAQFYTITAKFAEGYAVELNPVGGAGGDASFAAYVVDEGEEGYPFCPDRIAIPSRQSYVFKGFYEKKYSASGSFLDEQGRFDKNYWYLGVVDEGGVLKSSKTSSNIPHDEEGRLIENATLYADWARDVELDIQDGTTNDKVHATWGAPLPSEAIASEACDPAAGPATHTSKAISVPTREGYEFNGYWSTQYDESDSSKDLYYEVTDGAVVPAANKTWDIDQDRLYAHWKYKITLDSNVVDSDDEDALGDSAIAFDMSGYAGGTDGVYSDDYGNTYTVTKSGDDEVVSIEAIYGAPVKLPTVKGRTGYDDTQAWGVTKKENGCATDLFSLADGYTAKDGAAANIAEANGAFTLAPGADGINTVTLYADWTGKAKGYEVTLRSTYKVDDDNDFRSGADVKIRAVYDQPLLVADNDAITPSIDTPVYGADSKPTNLVFLGFTTEPNAAYSANITPHPAGDQLIGVQVAADGARTAVTMANDSTSGKAEFRLTDASGPIVLYALWGYPQVDIVFDLQDKALVDLPVGDLDQRRVGDELAAPGAYYQNITTGDAMPDAHALAASAKAEGENASSSRYGFRFKGFWNDPYRETGTNAAGEAVQRFYGEGGDCDYGATWDQTRGITLYAHWEYTVFLNLNAFNTDGELVLAESRDAFGAAVGDASAKRTEQSDLKRDGAFSYTGAIAQVVEGETATGAQDVSVAKYSFTAIDGAPIQMPQVTGRKGYDSTSVWGTEPAAYGTVKADSIPERDEYGVTDPFRPALTSVSGTGSAGRGYVLYADWTDKAQKLTVNIVNSYAYGEGDGRSVVVGTPTTTTIKAVYDQPLLIDGDADITPTLAAPGYDGTGTVEGERATRENLVFKGYYTAMNGFQMVDGSEVNTEHGTKYIAAVVDGAGTVTGTATATDPAAGDRAMRLREVGPADAPTTVTLYALWGYPGVELTFDLQGGTIAGDAAGFTVSAQTGADMGKLLVDAGRAAAPVREGYEFAGWWTTEYDESDASKQYYYGKRELDSGHAPMGAAKPTWDLYAAETTLYAHWRYTIDFDTQLAGTEDSADVDRTVVRPTNDVARTSGTVGLASAADDPSATTSFDVFGNRYTEWTDSSTYADAVAMTTIDAIAGAPVVLPSAHDRRQKMGADQMLVGYNPTWTWKNANGAAIALGEGADPVTLLDDSWTEGYGVEGSLPCKLGGRDALTGEAASDLLRADWSEAPMDYRVDVSYSYGTDDGTEFRAYDAGAAGGAEPRERTESLYVTYDAGEYYLDAGHTSKVADPLVDAYGKGTHARAVAVDGTVNDHLDFGGIRTAKNGIRTNGTAASALAGTAYWDRAGKLQQTRFRAIVGPEVKIYNTTDTPYPMYVLWQQPTRQVRFNLYVTDDHAQDANMSATGVELMKSDAVDKPEVSANLAALATELARAVAPGAARENYVFGGFWTTPWSETEAQEVDGEMIEPVCYYLLDDAGGTLRAPDPARDTWLTADNASTTWLEDDDTTLYAHWKYKVTFAMGDGDTIPGTSVPDRLLIGNATADRYGQAATSPVAFESLEASKSAEDATRSYVDGRGYITYGAPLILPVNQGNTGIDATAVTRIRDFDAASGYGFSGLGKTGYLFAGWTRDGSPVEGVDAMSGAASHADLRPGTGGVVELKASWTAIPFTVTLQNYPDYLDQYKNLIKSSFVKNDAGRTRTVTVAYDSRFGAAGADDPSAFIVPPELYGFTFRGLYGTDAGIVDEGNASTPVSGAGKQFYSEPVADASNAFFGKSPANATDAWFVPDPTIVSAPGTDLGVAGQAMLYAYYTRDAYTMTFLPREEGDGTLQATTGKVGGDAAASPYSQTWHYGDVLAPATAGTAEAEQHQAPGAEVRSNTMPQQSADTFQRQGYAFDGWYFYPEGAAHEKRNRIYVWRCDSTDASAVAAQPGVWAWDEMSGKWQKQAMTTWRTTDLFDAEQPNVTLYAGWIPRTYTVTFHPQIDRNGDASANNAYLNDPRTFTYEQLLTEADLPQVADANAPFEFVGWNRSSAAKPADTGGWLFAKNAGNYDPTLPDTTATYALMPVEGGYLFMPENPAPSFTYYGIWSELTNRNVVLFAGDHGTLSAPGGGTAQDFMVRSFNYDDGFDLTALEGKGISHRADTGYEFTGWVEASPEALGLAAADSYAGLNAEGTAGAEAKAQAVLPAVEDYCARATTEWGAVRFPEKLDTYNYTGTYRNVYTGERGLPYRDYYLVATYKIIDDYAITLDLGDAATYGEQINGTEVGARVENDALFTGRRVEDGRIRYSTSFTVNVGETILLPQPVSSKYDFAGWQEVVGGVAQGEPQMSVELDVEAYAVEAEREHARAKRTYAATWTEKEYTLRFQQDRFADDSHAIRLEGEDFEYHVKYSDAVKVPWPATRGTGHVFQEWTLLNLSQYQRDVEAARAEAEANGTDVEAAIASVQRTYGVGSFAAESEFEMRDLLYAMGKRVPFNGASLMNAGVEEGNVITFSATWSGDHINAVLPVSSVSVKVDPERGDILTADGLQLSVEYPTQYSGRQAEVVSLRYDKLDVDGAHVGGEPGSGPTADSLFGSIAGKVYLSLYADLAPSSADTSHLFDKDNVNEDGTLKGGLAADSANSPLLIDLAQDAVIARSFPYGADAAASAAWQASGKGGIYDGTRQLSDYGFRPFDQGDPLPLRYSLLFEGDSLSEFASKLPDLESDEEIPIAHMYYTIRLLPR